jgi:aspartyl aminopeptidase
METKELKEKLFYEPENVGKASNEEQLKAAAAFCEDYKQFLDEAKTEREAVSAMIRRLEAAGYVPFDPSKKYQPGDRVYKNNRGKALLTAVIGTEPIANGIHIAASHIDSPRVDLKQRPLYETENLAFFKTHYYGGIRKYQWGTIPLAMHGVMQRANGEPITICIGEKAGDPVFCITDLLPHLSRTQDQRKLPEGLKGEELNILLGSIAYTGEDLSESVKMNILNILFETYGITEKDFVSAEIEMVPAHRAADVGLDRSFVGAYGQDDRVCAYTSLMATIHCTNPKTTLVTAFADKEEIGSVGNTGLSSSYLPYFIEDLADMQGVPVRRVLEKSKCLSADVGAAYDPTFADVYEKQNSCFVNCGVSVNKFTGSRGKGGTSDASAEFVGWVTRMLDENNVPWQMCELGKVDQGGGGTVALYVAHHDVDTIDVGVPVLSMHAPFEVTAKLDVYAAYCAFSAFAKA